MHAAPTSCSLFLVREEALQRRRAGETDNLPAPQRGKQEIVDAISVSVSFCPLCLLRSLCGPTPEGLLPLEAPVQRGGCRDTQTHQVSPGSL